MKYFILYDTDRRHRRDCDRFCLDYNKPYGTLLAYIDIHL